VGESRWLTGRKERQSSRGLASQQSWPRATGIPGRRVTCGERLYGRFFDNVQHFFLRRRLMLLWHGWFFLGMLSHKQSQSPFYSRASRSMVANQPRSNSFRRECGLPLHLRRNIQARHLFAVVACSADNSVFSLIFLCSAYLLWRSVPTRPNAASITPRARHAPIDIVS
jgi:hypothetical protein